MSDIIFLEKKKPDLGPSAGLPVDDDAKRIFDTFKIGQKFEVIPWPDRNYKFHQKIFSLLGLVIERNRNWKSAYFLLKLIQIDIQDVEVGVDMHGIVKQFPKSISFKNMSEPAFTRLFSRTLQHILDNIELLVPGMRRDQLNAFAMRILEYD